MSGILYPKSKKITIAGKEFEIRKLPFRRLMEIADITSKIDFENNALDSADRMIDAIVVATGADKKWLEENLMAEEAASVFKEIMEVNKSPFKGPQGPGAEPEKQ